MKGMNKVNITKLSIKIWKSQKNKKRNKRVGDRLNRLFKKRLSLK
jgi:hypothetical protein